MAKTPKEAARVIFGNKEKKQFPDPEGLERQKPSSAIEGSTQPIGFETSRSRNKFSEAAPPMPGANQTLNNRIQRVGSVRRGVSLAAPRKEEVDGNMENKTFTQFVTEAKRGRPRKLKPGEQADTEHLQDQLSKLTHANHVMVHFKNGEKHEIPRAHANKALIHLSGLKPIHRADHVEHMHSSKENFYHTLSTKSIPSKKKTITLAGPKLRKEEVELEESHRVGVTYSDPNSSAVSARSEKKFKNVRVKAESEDEAIAKAKKHFNKSGYKVHGAEITTMKEAVEHDDDGWYAHKEIHGSKAISKEDWKKGVRPGKSLKKEEADRPKQNTKTDVDVRKHTRLAADALGRAHSLGRGHKDYDKHMAEYARHRKMALGEEVEQIDELTGKKKKLFGKDPLSAVANRAIDRMKLPPNDGSKLSPEERASNEKNTKVARRAFERMEEEVELDEAETLDSWTNKHEKAGRHITKDNKTARYHAWDKDEKDRFVKHHSSFSLKKSASNKMEEVESDEKKKTAHHKLLQKFKHRIDEVRAIKGAHATKQHAAKVINPGKVGYAGKGTKPKVQSLRREDYAPLESGEKQTHVDQKTANAKSRVQGGEKPKKPKMELTKEAWELYDSLSDAHKTIFEKMEQSKRDELVHKYLKSGGKVTHGKYNKPRESEKPFPASKMKGSKWADTAGRVNRKNQGYKK